MEQPGKSQNSSESLASGADRESAAGNEQGRTLSVTQAPSNGKAIDQILFPQGTEFCQSEKLALLDYYKLVAEHMEQLANRRQNLNSFFLSVNSALMAGVGVIAKESFEQTMVHKHALFGPSILMAVLSVTGLIICRNWGALITSYARMVQADSIVAEHLEKFMLVAIATAQARLHGTDYVSVARVEARIAHAFMAIYFIVALITISIIITMIATGTVPQLDIFH